MLTQRASDFQEVVETKISLAPLYTANVSGVQASALGQFLLRPPFCKSQLPNLLPESASI